MVDKRHEGVEVLLMKLDVLGLFGACSYAGEWYRTCAYDKRGAKIPTLNSLDSFIKAFYT